MPEPQPPTLTVRLYDEAPSGWWADVAERPGVYGVGASAPEALTSLAEAIRLTDEVRP